MPKVSSDDSSRGSLPTSEDGRGRNERQDRGRRRGRGRGRAGTTFLDDEIFFSGPGLTLFERRERGRARARGRGRGRGRGKDGIPAEPVPSHLNRTERLAERKMNSGGSK